jgi:DNA-binding response OmpR family regulator
MSTVPLRGQRILIAEDNALLAISMHDILTRAGAEVVGPAGTVAEAEQLAGSEHITAAVLDIKLHSSEIWSAARILAERGIPILFCSGHFDQNTLPPEWASHPILVKPARPSRIVDRVAQLVSRHH